MYFSVYKTLAEHVQFAKFVAKYIFLINPDISDG